MCVVFCTDCTVLYGSVRICSCPQVEETTAFRWMWGAGENGELGNSYCQSEQEPRLVSELEGEELVSVSLGGFHSAAVSANGDVLTVRWFL